MPSVIIADQTNIPSSFNGSSLFVNGVHIVDADNDNDIPLEDIAESLATALNTQVRTVEITEKQLATAVAKQRGQYDELEKEIDSGNVVYEDWNEGYNNDHVLAALS
jgi:hypothetical protein